MAAAITVLAVAALASSVGAQAQTPPPPPVSPAPVTTYEYDATGNPTKTIQAPGVPNFNFETKASYDTLDRRKDATDARQGITRFGYTGRADLTQLTDPRNLVTQYPRNGLGDATSQASPDTGTDQLTYDAAGNLKTRTDARGVKVSFYYDPMDRATAATWSQTGQASLSHVWQYDLSTTANGIGHLGTSTFPGGSWRYTAYDALGRLLTQTLQVAAAAGANSAQIVLTANYAHDLDGNLIGITYPSGRKLGITYTGGVASDMALAKNAGATPTPLISQIQWQPFGPPKHWLWQMASGTQAHDRVFDLSGRLVRYRLGTVLRDLSFDAADRISGYVHYDAAGGAAQPAFDQGFAYNELGQLTHTTLASTYWDFSFDANGNRTSATVGGNASAYTIAASSNRLNAISNPSRSFQYDNAGNIQSDGSFSAGYALTGRMTTLTKAGITSTYTYDDMGRRIRKVDSSGPASTVVFFYDKEGHLLGEYDQNGKALREYVWLGDTPIAVFTPDPAAPLLNPPLVFYIHADHLNTPQVVVDKNNQIRWQWFTEPFGITAANTNPTGLGQFTFPLRFPGQYADQESGLVYNGWRYYDPSTGRFDQSDPIGLAGGINTYAYSFNQPTRFTDPLGLDVCRTVLNLGVAIVQQCMTFPPVPPRPTNAWKIPLPSGSNPPVKSVTSFIESRLVWTVAGTSYSVKVPPDRKNE